MINKLSLEQISGIVNLLGESEEIKRIEKTTYLDDEKIDYSKNGNRIVIKSSNGKMMDIGINYSYQKEKDYQNRDVVYTEHKVYSNIYAKDQGCIVMSNQLSLNSGYEGFKNIRNHDLLRGLSLKYLDKDGKEEVSFTPSFNKMCLKSNNTVYEFNEEGISFNSKLVSLSGDKLLLISRAEVPNLDIINSFDLQKEQDTLKKFLDDNKTLHPFTVEAVEDSLRKLDRKERYVKDIQEFYNEDIKNVRKVINLRKTIMDIINNYMFSNDELEEVESSLKNNIRLEEKKKILK